MLVMYLLSTRVMWLPNEILICLFGDYIYCHACGAMVEHHV